MGYGAGLVASVSASVIPEPDVHIKLSGVHLVLNLPQVLLFHYQDGRLPQSYSVTVGKILTHTPTGNVREHRY